MKPTGVTPLSEILSSNMLRLGFGSGRFLHGLSRSESLRLVETAIDCGITYFDTARLYGLGGAEGILGSVLPRHRGRLIITSKAGILPPNRSITARMANRGVRLLHKAIPQSKDVVPVPKASHIRFGVFDLASLRRSLETSLRELKTDYLDIFLLHECTAADVQNAELLGFLQGLQKEGKIRKFGLATGIEETIRITKTSPQLTEVVQIANSIWNMNIKRLPVRTDSLTITHSTITERFHELMRRICSDDSLAEKWRSALKIDPRDKAALGRLLLAYALHLNPDGLVLFFSGNPENIRANARLAEKSIDADQIEGLNTIIEKKLMLPLEGQHLDHLSVS